MDTRQIIATSTVLVAAATVIEGGLSGLINPAVMFALGWNGHATYDDPGFEQAMAGNAILGAVSNTALALQGATSALGKFSLFHLTMQGAVSANPLSFSFLVGARFALGAALGNFLDRITDNAISPAPWSIHGRDHASQNQALLSGVVRSFIVMTGLSCLLNTALQNEAGAVASRALML